MDNQSVNTSIGEIAKGLLALVMVIIIIVVAIVLLVRLVELSVVTIAAAISSLDAAIIVALITGALSIITVVLGSVVNNVLKYRQQKQEFLRQRREVPYARLIALLYDIQMKIRIGEEFDEEELLKKMNEFNKELTLWGSSKAIKKWGSWRASSAGGRLDQSQVVFQMEQVIIQLRKDMGQKRGLRSGDILRLFINDVDEHLAK